MNFLQRLLRPLFHRSLDAAASGRRWDGAKRIDSLNGTILASATVAARRSAYYVRNNSWVASGVQSLIANSVGAGIKPRSRHPDPQVRAALHQLFANWTSQADASGLCDHFGQQALAVRAMIESGEIFARLVVRPEMRHPVPLQVELIDRDQVPLDKFAELAGGRVRAGIEFDAFGRRVSYHLLKARPNDPGAPLAVHDTVPVPAADVLHLFQPLQSGQLRGLTWLAPVLLRLHELDQFEDAALVKAKVAALFVGFITNAEGDSSTVGAAHAGAGVGEVGMEPGTLVPLPIGHDVKFADPPQLGGEYTPFVKNHLRAIAAGLGVPYELLSGDLEGVNYSSIRAGLVEFRRRVEQLQYGVIIHQFCRPIWERFVTVAVLSGALPAGDFLANPAPYLAVDWLPPKFDWVDPQKDVNAEILAINARLKSRSQAVAERGYDVEDLDAEIAADAQREARLGLAPAAASPQSPPKEPGTDEQ